MPSSNRKTISIKDVDWFKWVLRTRGISIRSLDASRENSTSWTERTIRKSLKEERISPVLLNEIAARADVEPNYLIGEYSWTLELPVMKLPGVRDYWIDRYLNPDNYPFVCYKQEKLGTHRQLLDTLLIHGVNEESFEKLEAAERRRVKAQLDKAITTLLRKWFPEARQAEWVDCYRLMEWKTEGDVMDALSDYLIDRNLATGSFG